jgi:hypothetical protein
VPELSDVRRFRHGWKRTASVKLRGGDHTAIAAYQGHQRLHQGDRDQMLDAAFLAWKADTHAGQASLMIAGDTATVTELNRRSRSDRVSAGAVASKGVPMAGGQTAGVGDLIVTRQNHRQLAVSGGWVKNGDRWTVTATADDGSITVKRLDRGGQLTLPAQYVASHVELAYATTAHRAQGANVDTAHTIVSPATTREALYVAATRGRHANHLYIDTAHDPDPATGHPQTTPTQDAHQVLATIMRNQGADISAHETLRRGHLAAESWATLQAEYQAIAAMAETKRWDDLIATSGFTAQERGRIRVSPGRGSLHAALRHAQAAGLDVDNVFPLLARPGTLGQSVDLATVLCSRVRGWVQAASRAQNQSTRNPSVVPAPSYRTTTDPDLGRALTERQPLIEGHGKYPSRL